jgi:hypothetical protein
VINEVKVRKVNWHQAIAEVALIILGILFALAVDSWWEDRSEREAEIDYLQSLRADFVYIRDSLSKEIEWEKNRINNGKEIHANIESGLTRLEPEDFIQIISDFYWFSAWEWEPVTATYDELIGSGHLKYIQSQALRIKLGQFVHVVDQLNEYRGIQISVWQTAHQPFIYEHLIVSDMNWMGDYRPVSPFKNDLGALDSKQFWNLVSDWVVSHNTMLWRFQTALEKCDEILEAIDSELFTKAGVS